MTALRAFCELNEAGTRIDVFFSYSPPAVAAIRNVTGRSYHDNSKGKYWSIPLSLTSARRLREEFGEGLKLGDAVQAWGREEAKRERNLGTLVTATDAKLDNVRAEQIDWLRPYQRADVKMMALTNVLNANQPGVGKTVEVIYAVEEADIHGLHVVIAPITLHKDPWRDELAAHAPDARVYWGSTPADRKQAMYDAIQDAHGAPEGDDIWLILNPDLVRTWSDKAFFKRHAGSRQSDVELAKLLMAEIEREGYQQLSKDHKGFAYYAKGDVAPLFNYPRLASLTIDEFHKHGIGEDRNTLFARAMEALGKKADRRYALSGTPMGGKPIRLWGCLYFIEPQQYGSKWRWAEEWLEIDEEGRGKKIGGIVKGREEAFYKAHAKHMVRRTRKDALPGLPEKVTINVTTPMTPKQRKAYMDFELAAEVAVEGGRISAEGVLAEFARLKQFANALCSLDENGYVVPTKEGGKYPVLLERLDGFGFRKDNPEPGARAIVASESKRYVDLVQRLLVADGIVARVLTGDVKGAKRDAVIDWYKEDVPEARVLVMTTQTGGVGLNLGMTGSVHILDETWNPDDQEQLEDRGMRNRTTPLICLYYRTEDSIQEYIAQIASDKFETNGKVLDTIREFVASRRA